jgi:Type IV secretory pathway, component VirB8
MLKKTKDTDLNKYFQDGETWEQEIIANALQSRNRAWLLSFFCMGIAVLSLITLLILLPLKTFEPYVVTVDRNTGYLEVTKGLYQGNLTQDEAITQANLVKYVSLRESYNPSILRENYEQASLMSSGPALEEYQKLWNGKNPNNPSIVLGRKAAIDIKIQSVSFLNDKTASIRFQRELKENGQIRLSHWTAIIDYQYAQKPMQMADRFLNPLGFQVTSYRVNPEILENVR